MPLGFNSSIYLTYIGKTLVKLRFGFQYKRDWKGNFDFGFNASKNEIFLKSPKNIDFLVYNYQKRKLDFIDTNNVFHDHQLRYGISIYNMINFSTGIDYLIEDKAKFGGIFGVSKWFYKPKINTTFISSIFTDEIDYKIGISKSILLNHRFVIRSTSIGLFFENFKDYNDLIINLTFWL